MHAGEEVQRAKHEASIVRRHRKSARPVGIRLDFRLEHLPRLVDAREIEKIDLVVDLREKSRDRCDLGAVLRRDFMQIGPDDGAARKILLHLRREKPRRGLLRLRLVARPRNEVVEQAARIRLRTRDVDEQLALPVAPRFRGHVVLPAEFDRRKIGRENPSLVVDREAALGAHPIARQNEVRDAIGVRNEIDLEVDRRGLADRLRPVELLELGDRVGELGMNCGRTDLRAAAHQLRIDKRCARDELIERQADRRAALVVELARQLEERARPLRLDEALGPGELQRRAAVEVDRPLGLHAAPLDVDVERPARDRKVFLDIRNGNVVGVCLARKFDLFEFHVLDQRQPKLRAQRAAAADGRRIEPEAVQKLQGLMVEKREKVRRGARRGEFNIACAALGRQRAILEVPLRYGDFLARAERHGRR